ncbi:MULTISPECIES: hypothetical protein [Brucella]|uniref:hypothetical protein n=1 Tax=Brucella TaxID=234 RepID=UPI000A48C9D4|nr:MULTISPECIES: hypothetical protein [Brucella]MCH6203399.1 hypothetical protein [Brucella ciceri]NYD82109.1 hypothetical protein [Brucella intermedia]
MSQPSETEIFNAIEYAMRCHPVEEEHEGEDGAWTAEIYDATSLTPFVMCLLRELKVIS